MSDLPAPLTAPDCDLRGYRYMPLIGQKLFASRFYTKAIRNPRAGIAGFKLWWVAFFEVPAGSLPDDDEDLALLADFGTDLKGWKACREVALHGFVKCSDGRLYHPVVCEEAVTAFTQRVKSREKRETDRKRLKAWRYRDPTDAAPPNGSGRTVRKGRAETPDDTHNVQDETRRETLNETSRVTRLETHGETRFVAGRRDVKYKGLASFAGKPAESLQLVPESDDEPPPHPGFDDADVDEPRAEPTPPSVGQRLFSEGLAILAALARTSETRARALLGKLASDFHDDARLLDVLLEASRIAPGDPVAWITARAKPRPPGPARSPLVCTNDPPEAFLPYADQMEMDSQSGRMRPAIKDECFVDVVADAVATAAGIRPDTRLDWSPLVEWIRAGIDTGQIIGTVRRIASRPGYQAPGSLRFFDTAVRSARQVA